MAGEDHGQWDRRGLLLLVQHAVTSHSIAQSAVRMLTEVCSVVREGLLTSPEPWGDSFCSHTHAVLHNKSLSAPRRFHPPGAFLRGNPTGDGNKLRSCHPPSHSRGHPAWGGGGGSGALLLPGSLQGIPSSWCFSSHPSVLPSTVIGQRWGMVWWPWSQHPHGAASPTPARSLQKPSRL